MSLSKTVISVGLAAAFSLAAHAGHVTVEAGKAKAIKLSETAESVIIGNPNIADVAVHNDKLLFVTGKSFGTTNLMIFDAEGNTIHSSDVVVTANATTWVSVKRAGENYTYDCSPSCRPTLSAGDNGQHYENVGEQLLMQKELNSDD
ncbi:MAG: pilus assembly protein N-terminal domain-containing protein [Henriciella sp.]|nr:pilus assembly protein N-terminal domain-containing protein [Henriciella sp.]